MQNLGWAECLSRVLTACASDLSSSFVNGPGHPSGQAAKLQQKIIRVYKAALDNLGRRVPREEMDGQDEKWLRGTEGIAFKAFSSEAILAQLATRVQGYFASLPPDGVSNTSMAARDFLRVLLVAVYLTAGQAAAPHRTCTPEVN